MNPKYFVPPLQPATRLSVRLTSPPGQVGERPNQSAKRQRVGETPKIKAPQEEFIKRVTIGGGGLRCG
jgi:hypothetical protein